MILFVFRVSEQDFVATHNNIRRGDIIGVKGNPGEILLSFVPFPVFYFNY